MLDQRIQSTLCRPLTPHTPPGAVIARYLATSFAIWILTGDANNLALPTSQQLPAS